MDQANFTSLSATGSQLGFISNDEVCVATGNGLMFLHPESGHQEHIWAKGSRRPLFATCKRTDSIAYTQKGLNPSIKVLHTTSRDVVNEVQGGTELEYSAIAFSNCGSRLVSVGSLPDFTVTVWDLNHFNKVLVKTTADDSVTGLGSSFFPGSAADMFCTFGPHGGRVYRVEKSLNEQVVCTVDLDFGDEAWATEEEPQNQALLTSFCWTVEGNLWVGNAAGELFFCDLGDVPKAYTPQIAPVVSQGVLCDSAIVSMVLTPRHLVAVDGEGQFKFMDRVTLDVVHTMDVPTRTVSSLAFSHDFAKFAVSTAEGGIYLASTHEEPSEGGDGEVDFHVEVFDVCLTHKGVVTGAVALSGGGRAVTAGADGTLRLWDAHEEGDGVGVAQVRRVGEPITCVSVHPLGRTLAVGTAKGSVYLLDADDLGAPHRFASQLHSLAVHDLAFSPDGAFLATVGHDERLFLVDVRETEDVLEAMRYSVVGWTPVPPAPHVVAWDGSDSDPAVMVSVGPGDMHVLHPPKLPYETSDTYELPPSVLRRGIVRMNSPLLGAQFVAPQRSDFKCYGLTAERKLAIFEVWASDVKQPDEQPPAGKKPSYVAPSEAAAGWHSKQSQAIALSPSMHLVATGGTDGALAIADAKTLKEVGRWESHDSSAGGITRVAWLSDTALIAAGSDGQVDFLRLGAEGPGRIRPPSPVDWQEAALARRRKPDSGAARPPNFLEERERRKAEETESVRAHIREGIQPRLQDLRGKVQRVFEKNAEADDLEKLPERELVVDHELEAELVAKGDAAANVVRDRAREQIIRYEIHHARETEMCIESMEAIGYVVRGLVKPVEVPTYTVRKPHAREVSRLRQVQMLRAVEKRETRRRPPEEKGVMTQVAEERATVETEGEDDEEAEAEADAAAEASRQAAHAAAAAAKKKKAVDDAEDEEEDEEDGEGGGAKKAEVAVVASEVEEAVEAGDDDRDLLYHPFELYTPQRKATQIVLLMARIREAQVGFNAECKAFAKRKQDDIDQIDGRNDRIQQIMEELETEEPLDRFSLQPEEEPMGMLEVKDSDVRVEKYVSPEEAARRAKEEAEARAAAEAAAKSDFANRALKDMMNGTLERKKKKVGTELVREEWMNLRPKEMTQDQRKRLKEFEAKVAAVEEEAQKQRMLLETELRTLKAEIETICGKFDAALAALFTKKVLLDQDIAVWELQVIRLASSMSELSDMQARAAQVAGELEGLKMAKAKTVASLAAAKKEAEAQRAVLEALQVEDKQIERTFRKDFVDDDDHFPTLLKYFRNRAKGMSTRALAGGGEGSVVKSPGGAPGSRRPGGHGHRGKVSGEVMSSPPQRGVTFGGGEGGGAGGGGGGAPGAAPPDPFDPYRPPGSDSPREKQKEPMDLQKDKPEGLEFYLWEKLMDHRDTKMTKEADIRAQGDVLAEATRQWAVLEEEDSLTRDRIERLLRGLNELRDGMGRHAIDLDMFFNLKQGQVEVEQAGFVTDFGDSVFTNRLQIERLNGEVLEKAGENVAILEQFKGKRRDIYNLQWENKRCELLIEDGTSKIKELQLLRVTKGLQNTLVDDEQQQQVQEEARLQTRAQALEKLHAEHVQIKQRKLRSVEKEIRERSSENKDLSSKTVLAAQMMAGREKLGEAHKLSQEQQATAQRRRLKNIQTNHRLRAIAQEQGQEIGFLTAELERLQRKSFPSFQTMPARPVGPDVHYAAGHISSEY